MNKKENEYIINPLTKRSIKINGRIFNTLYLSGYFKDDQIIKHTKPKKKYQIEYQVEDTELETSELETTEIDDDNIETTEIDDTDDTDDTDN